MKRSSMLVVSCCLLIAIVEGLAAQENQKYQTTEVIFTAPMEIPGRVLPAGKYLFTLLPGDPEHSMVQVWSADRQHLLATLLTVPDYHLRGPSGSSTVRFDTNRYGQTDALRAWFYPGDNYGHEFVHPEDRAKAIASRSGRPVLAMSNDLAAEITRPAQSSKEASVIALEKAKVEAITPSGQPVDKSKAFESMSQGSQPVTARPQ